jgi:hypothetical protein
MNVAKVSQELQKCGISKCKDLYEAVQKHSEEMKNKMKPIHAELNVIMSDKSISDDEKLKLLAPLQKKIKTIVKQTVDNKYTKQYTGCSLLNCLEENRNIIRIMIEELEEEHADSMVVKNMEKMLTQKKITAGQYLKVYKEMIALLQK